jgi:amicyanin
MNKTVVGIIVAILVLGGVGFAVANSNKKDNTDNTSTSQSTDTSTDMANMDTTNSNSNINDTDQPVATNNIEIKDEAFTPGKITVKAGTKVTWTNQDSIQHDVSPDQDYGDDFKGSDLLSKGQSYSFTFTKAGTYTYHCTPHPFMHGTIEVTE